MTPSEADDFGKTIWKPEHGQRRRFSTMDTTWVENILDHLERHKEHLHSEEFTGWVVLGSLQGEMASMIAEQQLNGLAEDIAKMGWFLDEMREYVAYRKEQDRKTVANLGALLRQRFAA